MMSDNTVLNIIDELLPVSDTMPKLPRDLYIYIEKKCRYAVGSPAWYDFLEQTAASVDPKLNGSKVYSDKAVAFLFEAWKPQLREFLSRSFLPEKDNGQDAKAKNFINRFMQSSKTANKTAVMQDLSNGSASLVRSLATFYANTNPNVIKDFISYVISSFRNWLGGNSIATAYDLGGQRANSAFFHSTTIFDAKSGFSGQDGVLKYGSKEVKSFSELLYYRGYFPFISSKPGTFISSYNRCVLYKFLLNGALSEEYIKYLYPENDPNHDMALAWVSDFNQLYKPIATGVEDISNILNINTRKRFIDIAGTFSDIYLDVLNGKDTENNNYYTIAQQIQDATKLAIIKEISSKTYTPAQQKDLLLNIFDSFVINSSLRAFNNKSIKTYADSKPIQAVTESVSSDILGECTIIVPKRLLSKGAKKFLEGKEVASLADDTVKNVFMDAGLGSYNKALIDSLVGSVPDEEKSASTKGYANLFAYFVVAIAAELENQLKGDYSVTNIIKTALSAKLENDANAYVQYTGATNKTYTAEAVMLAFLYAKGNVYSPNALQLSIKGAGSNNVKETLKNEFLQYVIAYKEGENPQDVNTDEFMTLLSYLTRKNSNYRIDSNNFTALKAMLSNKLEVETPEKIVEGIWKELPKTMIYSKKNLDIGDIAPTMVDSTTDSEGMSDSQVEEVSNSQLDRK